MKWLRAFTWYYRYAGRRSLSIIERNPEKQALGQYGYLQFYLLIPALFGCTLFALLHFTGLTGLVTDDYFPSFISTAGTSVFGHGMITFSATAVGLANLYCWLGMICEVPDALRPPNYKNKRHLWKDWPVD